MRNKRNATIAAIIGVIVCIGGGYLLLRGIDQRRDLPAQHARIPAGRAVAGDPRPRRAGVHRRRHRVHHHRGRPDLAVRPVPSPFRRRGRSRRAGSAARQDAARDRVDDRPGPDPRRARGVQRADDPRARRRELGRARPSPSRVSSGGGSTSTTPTATAKTDIITATQMVIPAGRDVKLHIQSNDVIHSFWIPALNGKKDAVPGHTQDLVMTAERAGHLRGAVHRVLRALPRRHADAGQGVVGARLRRRGSNE